jgi:hypothetical protein
VILVSYTFDQLESYVSFVSKLRAEVLNVMVEIPSSWAFFQFLPRDSYLLILENALPTSPFFHHSIPEGIA